MSKIVAIVFALAGLTGCLEDDLQAIVYYNFELLNSAPRGYHYQQFAQINGGVADLGCFVVEYRQFQCSEFEDCDPADPNCDARLRPLFVECSACPCTDRAADPCYDPGRRGRQGPPIVTLGEIRGTIDHPDGILRTGGVEYPTRVALDEATELFITVEPNFLDEPEPSGDVVLRGDATPDGPVLRGTLESPAGALVNGLFTIVPLRDEVTL